MKNFVTLIMPPIDDNLVGMCKQVLDRSFQSQHTVKDDLMIAWIRDPEIEQVCNSRYGSLFDHQRLFVQVFKFQNIGNDLSGLSPHRDRKRDASVICYIDLGGNNVSTDFYHTEEAAQPG